MVRTTAAHGSYRLKSLYIWSGPELKCQWYNLSKIAMLPKDDHPDLYFVINGCGEVGHALATCCSPWALMCRLLLANER